MPFLDPGPSLSPAQVSVMTRWRCVRVILFGTWLDECPRFPGVLEIIPSRTQVSQGTRCYELGFFVLPIFLNYLKRHYVLVGPIAMSPVYLQCV